MALNFGNKVIAKIISIKKVECGTESCPEYENGSCRLVESIEDYKELLKTCDQGFWAQHWGTESAYHNIEIATINGKEYWLKEGTNEVMIKRDIDIISLPDARGGKK